MGVGREGRQEGLRARKMARTRAAVEEAAMGLFLDRGYAATTIDDIAAAVEVSPRTVLRYFGSKEDILFAREREAVRRVGELLGGRPATEPVLGLGGGSARFAAGGVGGGAAGAAARSRLQAAVVVAAFRVALERWEAG